MESISPLYSLPTEVRYSPPWQDLSIIGIAGSSGSGKSSVAMEIVKSLNLPWVVILVMVQLVDHGAYQLRPFCSNIFPVGLILQDFNPRATSQGPCK